MNKKIINYLTTQHIIQSDETDIYEYALFVVNFNFICLLMFLIIGKLFNELCNSIIILLFFIPLRILIGGYHCKSPKTCLLSSCLMFVIIMLIYKFINIHYFIPEIILLFSVTLVHHYVNNRDEKQSITFIRLSIVFIDLLILIINKTNLSPHILISWSSVSVLYILNLLKCKN